MANTLVVTLLIAGTFQYTGSTAMQFYDMCRDSPAAVGGTQSNIIVLTYHYGGRRPEPMPPAVAQTTEPTTTTTTEPTTTTTKLSGITIPEWTGVDQSTSALQNTTDMTDMPTDMTTLDLSEGTTMRKRAADVEAANHERNCRCNITATGQNVTVNILRVWAEAPPNSSLHIGGSETSQLTFMAELKDYWNQSKSVQQLKRRFDTPYLTIGVQTGLDSSSYTLMMVIEDEKNLTILCPDSPGTNVDWPEGGVTGAVPKSQLKGTDQGDQMTRVSSLAMLIMGSVLFVFSTMLVVLWFTLWKRYRDKKRRCLAKPAQDTEMKRKSFPLDNYEEITETEDKVGFAYAAADTGNDSSRKASAASIKTSSSKGKSKHKKTGSNVSTDTDFASEGSHRDNKSNIFFQKNKGTKKKGHVQKERSSHPDEEQENEYSSTGEDYEEVSDIVDTNAKKHGIQVATPLLLAIQAGGGLPQLRKTEFLSSEARAKAKTLPKLETPINRSVSEDKNTTEDGEQYSHLERSGRARSYDIQLALNYDDVDLEETKSNQPQSKTVGIPPNSGCPVEPSSPTVPKNADRSLHAAGESSVLQHENSTCADDEDDADHIYEPFESEEDASNKIIFRASNPIVDTRTSSGNKVDVRGPDDIADYSDTYTESSLTDDRSRGGEGSRSDGAAVTQATAPGQDEQQETTYSDPDDLQMPGTSNDNQELSSVPQPQGQPQPQSQTLAQPQTPAQPREESEHEAVVGDATYETVQDAVPPTALLTAPTPPTSSPPPTPDDPANPASMKIPGSSPSSPSRVDTVHSSQQIDAATEAGSSTRSECASALETHKLPAPAPAVEEPTEQKDEEFIISENTVYGTCFDVELPSAIDVRL